MQNVKVKKSELIEKLKVNRENHIKEFKEAHAVWVEETIDAYKERIKNLKATGKNEGGTFGSQPQSQEKSYDRALRMLEMSVDEEVVLTEHEFSQYVMDEWQWTQQFKTVTASYNYKK